MYKKSYKMIFKQKLTSLKNAQISFLWSKRTKANTVSVNEQLPEVERPFLISVSELREHTKTEYLQRHLLCISTHCKECNCTYTPR